MLDEFLQLGGCPLLARHTRQILVVRNLRERSFLSCLRDGRGRIRYHLLRHLAWNLSLWWDGRDRIRYHWIRDLAGSVSLRLYYHMLWLRPFGRRFWLGKNRLV